MNYKIGFTTSLPVEVIFAAGHTPIDLNNIFINNNPTKLVRNAELAGFPRNICAWIKGMYGVLNGCSVFGVRCSEQLSSENRNIDVDLVIGIIQGDCSNTHSLMAILQDEGKAVLPFSYPWDSDSDYLDKEITKLENYFSVTRDQTLKIKQNLDKIRQRLIYLDYLTYQINQVSSQENHLWLVSSSDFNGDFQLYATQLEDFIKKAEKRQPIQKSLRLGFVGVPPILSDIYSFIETCDARVVFNEVQRQFSMPYLTQDIVEQYLKFTYPYSIFQRIEDIKQNIAERKIDGLICYTQSFCHRQLDLISLKKHIDIPILQLEADQPGTLDERTKLRLESFIEMLSSNSPPL